MNLNHNTHFQLFSFEIIEAPGWAPHCREWQERSEAEEKHDPVLR